MLHEVMMMLLEVKQQLVYLELLGQRKIKTRILCASMLFVSQRFHVYNLITFSDFFGLTAPGRANE